MVPSFIQGTGFPLYQFPRFPNHQVSLVTYHSVFSTVFLMVVLRGKQTIYLNSSLTPSPICLLSFSCLALRGIYTGKFCFVDPQTLLVWRLCTLQPSGISRIVRAQRSSLHQSCQCETLRGL